MTESADERIPESVGAVYRSDSRRILATLIRLLGDADLCRRLGRLAEARTSYERPTSIRS